MISDTSCCLCARVAQSVSESVRKWTFHGREVPPKKKKEKVQVYFLVWPRLGVYLMSNLFKTFISLDEVAA
jgi:hypothetical protein